jgi:hypothetical protein
VLFGKIRTLQRSSPRWFAGGSPVALPRRATQLRLEVLMKRRCKSGPEHMSNHSFSQSQGNRMSEFEAGEPILRFPNNRIRAGMQISLPHQWARFGLNNSQSQPEADRLATPRLPCLLSGVWSPSHGPCQRGCTFVNP